MQEMQEMQVSSLGQEHLLDKEMATLQYSCLENHMDRRAWKGAVHGVSKQSDKTELLSTHTHYDISSILFVNYCLFHMYDLICEMLDFII